MGGEPSYKQYPDVWCFLVTETFGNIKALVTLTSIYGWLVGRIFEAVCICKQFIVHFPMIIWTMRNLSVIFEGGINYGNFIDRADEYFLLSY